MFSWASNSNYETNPSTQHSGSYTNWPRFEPYSPALFFKYYIVVRSIICGSLKMPSYLCFWLLLWSAQPEHPQSLDKNLSPFMFCLKQLSLHTYLPDSLILPMKSSRLSVLLSFPHLYWSAGYLSILRFCVTQHWQYKLSRKLLCSHGINSEMVGKKVCPRNLYVTLGQRSLQL